MYKSLSKLVLFSSCSVFSLAAVAGGSEIIQAGWWPYPAGATATALSGEIATGFADGMIPVYGKPTEFFYFDPQGQINNSHQYAISAGVGGRYLWQDKGILGAYLFGDYNHSEFNNSFWFVSPGLEFLGDSVDITGNLYIPVGTQKYGTGNDIFGQDIGIFTGVTFAGNTEYDELYETSESSGFGGDIDVAYRIPLNKYNPKLHVAAYFSNPQDAEKDRTGGAIRLDFPFSEHLSVLVADSYDTVSHNTVRAGASYSFGGRHTSYNYKNDLASRMVDPIQRNLIANTSDIRNSQPISENTLDTNGSAVYLDNITFFVPDPGLVALIAGGGDGTYEHPYGGMSQNQIDAANAAHNNNFFVQSGTYGNPDPMNFGGPTLTLTNDNLYGRQSYNGNPFVQQAEEHRRPIFNFQAAADGFVLLGSSNTVSSVYIVNELTGAGNGIMYMDTGVPGVTSVVNVDNVEIFGFHDGGNGVYVFDAAGASDIVLNVNNSFIYDSAGGVQIAYASSATNTVTANVSNSEIRTVAGVIDINDSSATANLNLDNDIIINSRVSGIVQSAPAVIATVNESGGGNSGVMSVNISQCTIQTPTTASSLLITNNSVNPLTLNVTDTVIQNSRGPGIQMNLMNSGDINANILRSSLLTSDFGLGLTLTSPFASGNINAIVSNSKIVSNTTAAANLTLDAGTSGDINLIVNSTTTAPTVWAEDVLETVLGTGTATTTFNAANGSFSIVNAPLTTVSCESSGLCTTF